jgi:hypothetical protein
VDEDSAAEGFSSDLSADLEVSVNWRRNQLKTISFLYPIHNCKVDRLWAEAAKLLGLSWNIRSLYPVEAIREGVVSQPLSRLKSVATSASILLIFELILPRDRGLTQRQLGRISGKISTKGFAGIEPGSKPVEFLPVY